MTTTKDNIVDYIKNRVDLPLSESKTCVETLVEIIKSRLENNEEVKISGFGKWTLKLKNERPGRNPHTGERISITKRKVVTFHPSEKLRAVVNHSSDQIEEVHKPE